MALAAGGVVEPIADSGSCMGAGDSARGGWRPRGPSGDDCVQLFVGLEVNEGTAEPGVEAEVSFQGTAALAGPAFDIGANNRDTGGTLHDPAIARVGDVAANEVIVWGGAAMAKQAGRVKTLSAHALSRKWIGLPLHNRCLGCLSFPHLESRAPEGRRPKRPELPSCSGCAARQVMHQSTSAVQSCCRIRPEGSRCWQQCEQQTQSGPAEVRQDARASGGESGG